MQVIRAHAMGMCFGVRDALAAVARVPDPAEVTIHGELVHNQEVVRGLALRGFRMSGELERSRVPDTPLVLVTAHGVSDAERERLRSAGKRLIDTTCPLVARVHDAARSLASEGYHVLLIGRRGHVEVEGITGDLERFDVLESPEEVRTYSAPRLGVVSQTTSAPPDVEKVLRAVEAHNPHAEIRFIDTVCQPTKDRQQALEDLLAAVDAVVVVGGANSNNTHRLADRCRRSGVPVHLVQTAADLEAAWFRDYSRVGLTAGTSTLDETIASVHAALLRMGEEPASA